MKRNALFTDGNFFVGVNYWASHAGMKMWQRWDEATVIRDLDLLKKADVNVIRIFPLWPDFQPIITLYGNKHCIESITLQDEPFARTEETDYGIDPVMMERLYRFLDLCLEREISVILSVLTGWMSGRLFVPTALESRNLISDPTALKWEQKFIKYMVSHLKYHEAIEAWGIGNEVNEAEQPPETADAVYAWLQMLVNAIKAEDNTRLIISDMHSLDPHGVWNPQDQGEIMDVMCTHPYPAFTPHCGTDPVNRMKSANHAVAESLMYGGLSKKPCFAEEINVLGPMFANEELTAANADMAMFGLWAHNCFGYMWWCACDQRGLTFPPYDWNALERELGLIYGDGTHVKALDRMTAFAAFTKRVGTLPKRICDAVCILTKNQDSWAVAFGTFLLAKQAGIELEFAYMDMEIPKAKAYFVPSLLFYGEPSRYLQNELLRRVAEDGASLYLSMDGGMMSEFDKATGFELVSRSHALRPFTTTLNGKTFELPAKFDFKLRPLTAEVLAADEKGDPVFGRNAYGKGYVYFLKTAVEHTAATLPSVIDGENQTPYYEIYKALRIQSDKVAAKASPFVGLTEHVIDETSRYLMVINYEPEAVTEPVTLDGYLVESVDSVDGNVTVSATDTGFTVALPANTGAIVKIVKK